MALVQDYALYLIGGSLVLGFVLAWILRGLKKSPAEQRAIVDRDIALLELQQTKDELDSLFAAQRKRREAEKAGGAGTADPALKAEIARLEEALAAAKAENAARREAVPAAGTGAAPAVSESAAPKPRSAEETALRNALISRNEYLETRIHDVELRLHHMAKALKAAEEIGSTTAPAVEADAKRAWLANYSRQRMEALEARLAMLSGAVPNAGQETSEAEAEAEPTEEADKAEASRAADEELARLRWRNRYLESRLAYLAETVDPPEENASPEANPAPAQAPKPEIRPATQTAEKSAKDSAPAAPQEKAGGKPMAEAPKASTPKAPAPQASPRPGPDRLAERGPRFTSPAFGAPKAQAEEGTSGGVPAGSASSAVGTVQAARPPALEVADGKADDLTRISGLSSSIELRLNEVGIWHFSQIAAWTPEHEAWIDREFGLEGLARREGWVSQARQLG